MSHFVELVVPGPVKGKGRPRMTKSGSIYTPRQTTVYENLIKQIYITEAKGIFFEQGVPLKMQIVVGHPIPKAATKTKRQAILDGLVYPTTKPDLDNVIKIVMDGLCGVAYADDRQIVCINAQRIYDTKPYVRIKLEVSHGR